MQIILLSGGSGKRLWPLSNGIRSKQFLKLLESETGGRESMIQRVMRQIRAEIANVEITVATSAAQRETVMAQLGENVSVVTEPERRDTFPAIALTVVYLVECRGLSLDEVVTVMPCDPYTEAGYYEAICDMAEAVANDAADIVLMGIKPSAPSAKFGYMVPRQDGHSMIERFVEKPSEAHAAELIAQGAYWNGGVFAFRLGYLFDIVKQYVSFKDYDDFLRQYGTLPRISFDYEVVEKAESVGVVYYSGLWKDLGTWGALAEHSVDGANGQVVVHDCESTTVVNELKVPVVCLGTNDLIVAASPDGILVADSHKSEMLKDAVKEIDLPPLCEEFRWGEYRIIDINNHSGREHTVTKLLNIKPEFDVNLSDLFVNHATMVILGGKGQLNRHGKTCDLVSGSTYNLNCDDAGTLMAETAMSVIIVGFDNQYNG